MLIKKSDIYASIQLIKIDKDACNVFFDTNFLNYFSSYFSL